MRYTFANCTFDVNSMQLVVDGVSVPIQPQVFDVLHLLIIERDRIVSKQELLERVWGHTYVTESALTSRIKSARQAIGDDGREQRLIRTVHGRGYQFVGELKESRRESEPIARATHKTLPRFDTTLVGREADATAVSEHLEQARLLTILGPGGVGKTRLAVEVAERSASDSAFVDLTLISDPALVMSQIAVAIGLHTDESLPEHGLVEYLTGRGMLLVIDNAEHVIDAAVAVSELVRSVADLAVIVTSRERLRVRGEQVYQLDPLDLEGGPGGQDDMPPAITLFGLHALAVDPDFDLDRHRASVERICRDIEGLPLAIELAASQVRTLPPDMLASRLGERLRSSSGSGRDLPTRQRTMKDAIDWSLQLVTANELTLFRSMGVFAGAVDIDTIERVCRDDDHLPDPVDVLGRLIDCSLVRRTTGRDGVARFGMLEVLRQRATELLRDDPTSADVERRYREYVADALWDIDGARWSGLVTQWIDQITALRTEARRAFASAVSVADWETASRIAGSLTMYHHREGGLAEGRRWLEVLAPHHDDLSEAVLGRVLLGEGLLAWHHDDQASARSAWEQALDVLQRIDDDARSAFVLASLAVAHLDEPDEHDRCRALIDQGVAQARRNAEPVLLAEVLNIAGEFARATGDDASARLRYEEALRLASDGGDATLTSIALANLSLLACHAGDFEEARRIGRRALEMCWALNRRQLSAWSASELAGAAAGLGEHDLAAILIGGAQRSLEQLGGRLYPPDLAELDRTVAKVVGALGSQRFSERSAEGRSLSLDELVALALGREH